MDEHLATFLCALTNAKQRVGYTDRASPAKRRVNRGFDTVFSTCLPAGPVQHEVWRNLAIVRALGGTVYDSRLEVRLTERDRERAERQLAGIDSSARVIAVGIGASGDGRRWPITRYAKTLSGLSQRVRVQPVIVCSSREREQAQRLAELLGRDAIILSGAPLRVVCAVLERSDLFIGNDSGAAHLAAAMNCRTLVISRHPRDSNPNHSNSPHRFRPYCEKSLVLQPATGLDACTQSCHVREAHCILAVSVDEVVAAAQELLGRCEPVCASAVLPRLERKSSPGRAASI